MSTVLPVFSELNEVFGTVAADRMILEINFCLGFTRWRAPKRSMKAILPLQYVELVRLRMVAPSTESWPRMRMFKWMNPKKSNVGRNDQSIVDVNKGLFWQMTKLSESDSLLWVRAESNERVRSLLLNFPNLRNFRRNLLPFLSNFAAEFLQLTLYVLTFCWLCMFGESYDSNGRWLTWLSWNREIDSC